MKKLNLERGFRCSKNFEIVFSIDNLNQFYAVLLNNESIYARHRVYPTAFFFSWPIKLVKNWIDYGYFYTITKIKK